MAKKVFEITLECFNANKTKNGSTITLAKNVQQTEKGPATRTAVNILVPDSRVAGSFDTDKEYVVTITEK